MRVFIPFRKGTLWTRVSPDQRRAGRLLDSVPDPGTESIHNLRGLGSRWTGVYPILARNQSTTRRACGRARRRVYPILARNHSTTGNDETATAAQCTRSWHGINPQHTVAPERIREQCTRSWHGINPQRFRPSGPAGDVPPPYSGEIAPTFGNGSCQKILAHPHAQASGTFLAAGRGGRIIAGAWERSGRTRDLVEERT